MGVQYSKLPVAYGLVRSDTVAHFIQDLDKVLGSVGWADKVSLIDGWRYQVTSPQGYTCRIEVELFDTYDVRVQFFSADGGSSGWPHTIRCGAGDSGWYPPYEVVAGACQLFVSMQGFAQGYISVGRASYAVMGGIPYRPGRSIQEIWWSCGAGSYDSLSFRNSRYCSHDYSYCLDGGATLGYTTVGPQDNPLQLYPLTSTLNIDGGPWPPRYEVRRYHAGAGGHADGLGLPLNIDALMGWEGKIQGQLWDAFQMTAAQPLDATFWSQEPDSNGNLVNTQWLNWSNGTGNYWSTLWLLLRPPVTAGTWNVAY